MTCIFTILTILITINLSQAQNYIGGSFLKFTEGIFINFAQVKNNNPIRKNNIKTAINKDDIDYFDKLLENKKIQYLDTNNIVAEIETNKIYGYAKNGRLYINYNDKFNRITTFGSISHFISTIITTYHRSPSYYRGMDMGGSYEVEETKQYILNFETGEVKEFDEKSVENIVKKDAEIYKEWQEKIVKEELQKHFVQKTFKQRKENGEFTGRHKINYKIFEEKLQINKQFELIEDGPEITSSGRRLLNKERDNLGISEERAKEIENHIISNK